MRREPLSRSNSGSVGDQTRIRRASRGATTRCRPSSLTDMGAGCVARGARQAARALPSWETSGAGFAEILDGLA